MLNQPNKYINHGNYHDEINHIPSEIHENIISKSYTSVSLTNIYKYISFIIYRKRNVDIGLTVKIKIDVNITIQKKQYHIPL